MPSDELESIHVFAKPVAASPDLHPLPIPVLVGSGKVDDAVFGFHDLNGPGPISRHVDQCKDGEEKDEGARTAHFFFQ
jgi:hypothetical protein